MQGIRRCGSFWCVWCARLAVKAELVQNEQPAISVRLRMQDVTWTQSHYFLQGEQAHFRYEKGGGVEEITV